MQALAVDARPVTCGNCGVPGKDRIFAYENPILPLFLDIVP